MVAAGLSFLYDAMPVVAVMPLLLLLLLLLQHGRARALKTAMQPATKTVTWGTYLSSPAVLYPLQQMM
jgi:hypothetical protein